MTRSTSTAAVLGPTTGSHYAVNDFTVAGADSLLRLLTCQPEEIEPPLGRPPLLPARDTDVELRQAGQGPGVTPSAATLLRRTESLTRSADESFGVAPIQRIFLHFFDPHFLDEVARGRNSDLVAREAQKATRLAVLAAKTVFVPAASYIECSLCTEAIDEYRGLFDTGQVVLVGGEANLIDFATAKLLQYDEGSERFSKYEAVLSSFVTTPPFRSRTRSATRDISSAWLRRLDDFAVLLEGLPIDRFTDLEFRWAEVPAWLGERAFTPEYVIRGLFDSVPTIGPELVVARRAGAQVNSEYFKSYTTELSAGLVTDLTYLYSAYTGNSQSVDLPYRRLLRELEARGVLDLVFGARPERLVEIRHNQDIAAAVVSCIAASRPAVQVEESPGPAELAIADVTHERIEWPPSRKG